MKQVIKRSVAIILVVLMSLSSSMYALAASVDTDFSLEIKNVTKHYAGMTYTVTARLDNLTADELTQEEFSWSIDDASTSAGGSVSSISTMNKIVGDGTYTVTQTASVKLPDSTGVTTVTAAFGSYSKTLDVTRLEPIRSINIASPQTDNKEYYFAEDGTLYLNSATGTDLKNEDTHSAYAILNYQTNETDDDHIEPALAGNGVDKALYDVKMDTPGQVGVRFKSMNAPEATDLVLRAVPSGRTEAVVKLVECTRLNYNDIYINNNRIFSGRDYDQRVDKEEPAVADAQIYTGTSYTVSAANPSPSSANDTIKYTLYNSDMTKQLDCYSIDAKGNCVLNIPDSGKYILKCTAVSKGGYLPRSYEVTVEISAAKPNYISGIALKQVDENGQFLAEDFDAATMYMGSNLEGGNKYNLSQHVKIANTTNYSAEDAVMYESSDNKVVTVDSNGMLTAVGSGTATITVYSKMGVDEFGNKTVCDTCDIQVYQLVNKINISCPSSTLPQGHSIKAETVVTPAQHDETISWGLSASTPDSQGNYPLLIQQDGTVTANPEYDFEGKSEVTINVIATARLEGTTIAETTAICPIRVIPSINTKYLEITASQPKYGFLVEDANGNYSDSNTLHQDSDNGDTVITYNGDSFSINGVGYDTNPSAENANRATDVYKWTVAYSGTGKQFGDEMTLQDAATGTETNPNKYLNSVQYSSGIDTYTVVPQINGVYRFTCYAVNRGDGISDAKATSTFTVKVVYPAKNISLSVDRTIIPVGESITVKTNLDSSDAYRYDAVSYTSVNTTVATVQKAEDYSTSFNVIVTAGNLPTSDYVEAIRATTRSGQSASIRARITDNIKNALIELEQTEYLYDGTEKKPAVSIYVGTQGEDYRLLTQGTDYNLKYYDNVNAGIASIEITGINSYAGSTTVVHFTINKKSLGDGTVMSDYLTQDALANYYDITPTNPTPIPNIVLRDTQRNNTQLKATTDYVITAINNTTAGVATATVTGQGNYEGSYTFAYTVMDYIGNVTVSSIPDQVFTGKEIKPEISLTYSKQVMDENGEITIVDWVLEEGKDYTLSYSKNTNVGEATININGVKPSFKDTKTVKFNIIPIKIQSTNPTTNVKFTTDASSGAVKNYGLLEKDGNTYAYLNDEMTILGIGTDANGKNTNNTYKWQVRLEDGTVVDLQQPTGNTDLVVQNTRYLTYKYNPNSTVYTVWPRQLGTYSFICTATDGNENTAVNEKTITVVKASSIYFDQISNTTIPVNGKVTARLNFRDMDGYKYNDCTFKTNNVNVAKVEKDADYSTTYRITITSLGKVGNATITATTRNGATASINVNVKEDIASATITGINPAYEYTGSDIKPEPILSLYGYTLRKDTDYSLRYDNCREAGKATLTITGKGNDFAGEVVINYTISTKSLATLSGLTATVRDQFYRIDANNPAPVPNLDVKYVKADGSSVTLQKDRDYTVTCTNNTKAGTAKATVKGIGNYSGTKTVYYKVCDDISKVKIATIASQSYTGTVKTPAPVVTYNGTTLKKGVDYTVRYQNNINVGTATVFIDGISPKFYGTTSKTFKINPKKVNGLKTTKRTSSSITLSWTAQDNVTGYQIYDTVAKKIVKRIEDKNTRTYTRTGLTSGKEYRYQVRAYANVNGVIYYGLYSSITYTYTTPKIPALKLTTTSKTVKASWTKVSGVSGYEIQRSTKSSFSGASTTKLSSSTVSKKYTGLTKGKTYYVRIRSYKNIKVNGKTVKAYSSWKTLKIKCK
ncbi:MAG: fibronectin type III domain-containing protein [Eubacteriales bacterium]|nr:fibronectin type III domain-containing protein [Eubacteriales bacterium]